jgi:threonine/homoserine/homoserine lactone efflux protein
MYRLVVTILVAGGVIFFGVVAAITFFVMLFKPDQWLLSIIPLAVAAWLLFVGYRSMSIAVRFLRGVPPRQNWERWIFSL